MNPDQLRFGSGSPLLGGVSPLQMVMQQQQQGGAGTLQQQTPNSAGFDPNSQQALQGAPMTNMMPGQPDGQPQPQGPMPQPQGAPPDQGLPPGSMEAQTIIDALSKRLDNDSKMKMEIVKAHMQANAPQVTPPVDQASAVNQ